MTTSALDAQKVAAARLWATARMPYLASAIFASTIVVERDSGSITIDRSWQVHADPTVVEHLTVEQLGRLLVHLSGHAIRDHASRAQQVGVAENNQRADGTAAPTPRSTTICSLTISCQTSPRTSQATSNASRAA
jgi:hypothetical protein